MFLELASEKAFELLDGCFDANNEELEELLQKLFLKQGISLWKVLQVVQMKQRNTLDLQNCGSYFLSRGQTSGKITEG